MLRATSLSRTETQLSPAIPIHITTLLHAFLLRCKHLYLRIAGKKENHDIQSAISQTMGNTPSVSSVVELQEPEDYEYHPLEPRCIRILKLHPSSGGSELSGELIAVSIDSEHVGYDALSYMWGDPTPVATLSISGKALPLAENLATALRHLRYADKPLIIWADAICINQQDTTERENQIKLMRLIFRLADTVRIWINEPNIDERNVAVSALKDFRNAWKEDFEELGLDPSFWDPIAPIFSNPYWNRAWIQQEVLNASHLNLHCWNIVIPGASLARFQTALIMWKYWAGRLNSDFIREWATHLEPFDVSKGPASKNLAEHMRGIKPWTLIELLERCGQLGITDSRDRVYAVMYLAADYEDGGIGADYSKTELDVLVEAAAYHVSRNQNLDFLHQSSLHRMKRRVGTPGRYQYIPTWLPRIWMGYKDFGYSVGILLGGYQAKTLNTKCPLDSVCTKTKRVKVRGLKVDTVRRCLTRNLDLYQMTVQDFWDSLLGLYLRSTGGVKMQKLPLEIYNTLMTNSLYGENTTPDIFASALACFNRLSQNPHSASMTVGYMAKNIAHLLPSAEHDALRVVLDDLTGRAVIMTEDRRLGCCPECDIEEGDEIWVVLGCSLPVVLRPQDHGTYVHVCTSRIPKLLENSSIRTLSDDIQPGDRIGEWTVADIELE